MVCGMCRSRAAQSSVFNYAVQYATRRDDYAVLSAVQPRGSCVSISSSKEVSFQVRVYFRMHA